MEKQNKLAKVKSTIATSSDAELLRKWGPKNCLKYSGKVSTIDQAMNSNSISLGTVQREKGRDFTEGLIMGWLVYLNDILNLNKPMSEDQIEMCATEILNEFYGFKFSDLTLIFKRIISGAYGEFYEALSIPKILSWFRQYFEERCELAMQQSQKKHKDFNSDETFAISKNLKRRWKN
jgi:hypothetical protein